jgi:hypothetical protein
MILNTLTDSLKAREGYYLTRQPKVGKGPYLVLFFLKILKVKQRYNYLVGKKRV